MNTYSFVTDTATFCVFDLAALKHRLDDDDDWWSLPEDELDEVNRGNVAFVGVGGDGQFRVTVLEAPTSGHADISVNLRCPSGRLFVGAGEEVTSGGLEPEALRGGGFFSVPTGTYSLHMSMPGPHDIKVYMQPATNSTNRFEHLLRFQP